MALATTFTVATLQTSVFWFSVDKKEKKVVYKIYIDSLENEWSIINFDQWPKSCLTDSVSFEMEWETWRIL